MWRRHAARLAGRCSRYAAGGGLACFAAGVASWSDARVACKGKPTAPQLQTFHTRVSDINKDYEFGPQLGSGAYGNVYRGRCKATGKVVAIKALPKRKENEAMVRAEVAALRRGALHRSISEIYDFYEAPTVFYIVMEFVDGGELLDHLVDVGPLSERKAARLVQEVGCALALLHAQGLCHSDIKPENVLLTKEGQVRLVDFGLTAAKDLNEAESMQTYGMERRGTLPYLPPEAIGKKQGGLPSDLWALGVVLFMTLGGYHPFDNKGESDLKQTSIAAVSAPPDFDDPIWAGISTQARHLLNGLLNKDPSDRLTIEQLLQHPWVVSGGVAAGDQVLPRRRSELGDPTSGLRAAVFATILQQQVSAGEFWATRTLRSRRLHHRGSLRAPMLDSELLWKAFTAFDTEGKGYITEKDLRRVLGGWGQREATEAIRAMLQGGAGGDRAGSRVTYGNYISMMGLIDKAFVARGDYIIKEGDQAAYFYALLSGTVEVHNAAHPVSGPGAGPVAVLRAGEDCYFGETEMLDRKQPRYANSVRCCAEDGCELLKLAKTDFEAGFLASSIRGYAEGEAEATRRRLLGFIQMVSPKLTLQLKQGEVVPGFREGDPADRYYILRAGSLRVEQGGVVLGTIEEANGFGESGLLAKRPLRSKTIRCDAEECELVSIAAPTLLRLVAKSSVIREMMQDCHQP